jgi:hypothetical protein
MFRGRRLALAMLVLGEFGFQAAAQNTKDEFWPELGVYVQQGSTTRLVFVDSFNQDQNTRNATGAFTYYLDFALKPVLRPELRWRDDALRSRYLTFRAGYQYRTSFVNADSTSENRGIVEFTSRFPLPGELVLADRNRGEFRFIKGQPFSTRYRNRLRLDRDCKLGSFAFTPYVYDEIFYDTRYDAWIRNRYAIGVQVPSGAHVVIEPYILRQKDSRSTPPHVDAFGITLNLYF